MPDDFAKIQEHILYQFHDMLLLKQALTHSSYANELVFNKTTCNERLEFLGDAVLELIVSEYIFKNNLEMSEGQLTKLRARMVCESTLAAAARKIYLGRFIFLGKGENQTGGRERDSILSDVLEALIGAVYLDGGFTSVKEMIQHILLDAVNEQQLFYDSKTILQEIVQSEYKQPLQYVILGEQGPDHNKEFVVAAMLNNTILSEGRGRTKKAAEQDAAYNSIQILQSKVDQG